MEAQSQSSWRGLEPARRARGLNSLYTRAQLESVLHRERARSDRHRCEFSLILFRVRADERRLTLRLARLLLRRSRGIDEIGWFDDTCVAALLPYTGGEGARSFAENTLKLAQQELIPAICRIYTYPSAWYFDEDGGTGNRTNRHLELKPDGKGRDHHNGRGGNGHHGNGHNGHSAHGANGHGANGHNGHALHGANGGTKGGLNDEGDSNGHNGFGQNASGHSGNGHNGIGHHGNGHANGNGRHADGSTIARSDRRMSATALAEPESDRRLTASAPATEQLLPFVLQGIADGLQPPDVGNDAVETLLVRPLPWWKRGIDILGAGIGLVLLSPIMILSALAIKGTSRGPVMFRQRRAGLGGQPFWIYKFRTMAVDAEARKAELRNISEQDGPAFKLKNDPRITSVGKILRETSLDELPQLWNVLLGDMSLVGPRPLPMDESAGCDQWQRSRLDVTPGLTCIWQVKGRSRVTFDEWMRMDVNYIRRRNFFHDVKILSQTIPAVLLRKGAR